MSPYELTHIGGAVEHMNAEPGALWLRRVTQTYKHCVWLNPVAERALGLYAVDLHDPRRDGGAHVSADLGRARPGDGRADALTGRAAGSSQGCLDRHK